MGSPASAALVISFQQYWSGSSSHRSSDGFSISVNRVYIGLRCGGGSAGTGIVTLMRDSDGASIGRFEASCDGTVRRSPNAVSVAKKGAYQLVWSGKHGPSNYQGVYVWR